MQEKLNDYEKYGGMDPNENTLSKEEAEFLCRCSEEENYILTERERLGIFKNEK